MKILERFWSKVDVRGETECWLWTAGTAGGGYGAFWLDGRMVYAHRVAYELLTTEPIPEGTELDHVKARGCTSTLCVNPAHLEPVSHAENVRRGDGGPRTHCKHGHPLSGANLYVEPSTGKRFCRICRRELDQRRRHRRSAR